MAPLASVIIPSRNRSQHLARTLSSFVRQTETDFELVIVNDGGSDGTDQVIEQYAKRLRLQYVRRRHGGRAAARNAGISRAAGTLLIFSDDDRIVVPAFIAEHIAAFAADSAGRIVLGEQRGIVPVLDERINIGHAELLTILRRQPQLLGCETTTSSWITPEDVETQFDAIARSFGIPEAFWEDRVRPVVAQYGEQLEGFFLPWAIGATGNLSVPKALVLNAGGFDERFVGWGLEDVELHYRLATAGTRTVVCHRAQNFHQVHDRGGSRMDEWRANAARLLDKHPHLDVAAYFCGLYAQRSLIDINRALSAYHGAARVRRSELLDEFERLTLEHARLLTRLGSPP
jgi:glycosyltransferase involved in cell wall biosynthesis